MIVVATVPSLEPYADINEYAVKLFENHGRGIGDKGKDNGLLIVLALKERQDRVEVGYDLEQWITDGYAGETRREFMAPQFRQGQYGAGLLAGTERIAARIAQGRGVVACRASAHRVPRPGATTGSGLPLWAVILIFVVLWLLGRSGEAAARAHATGVAAAGAAGRAASARSAAAVARVRRRRIRRRLRRIRRWEQRRRRQRRQLVRRAARGKLCI